MGFASVPRPWVVFSSSSGETLRTLLNSMHRNLIDSCEGLYCDRQCGSAEILPSLGFNEATWVFEKKEFESRVLQDLKETEFAKREGIILLCGYFGILSEEFLNQVSVPIVNTHPSLLPAFPGLDKKVHQAAFESTTVSGFTVHLVTSALDGGPVLFQHPVWSPAADSVEIFRERVRKHEQHWLPKIWSVLLTSDLKASDAKLSSRELRSQRSIDLQSFESLDPELKSQKENT